MVDIKTEASRYYFKGDHYFDNHDMTKAKLSYIRYVKLNCGSSFSSAYVYCNWACSLYYQHKYQKAIYKFKQATLYNPRLEYIYNGWGSALSNLGKFDEAIEILNQALKIRPNYLLAQMNIVLALLLKKNEEEALKYFEKVNKHLEFTWGKDHVADRFQKEEKMLDIALRETYFIQFEYTAIRLQFTYYHNAEGWLLHGFVWNDSFIEEFK